MFQEVYIDNSGSDLAIFCVIMLKIVFIDYNADHDADHDNDHDGSNDGGHVSGLVGLVR